MAKGTARWLLIALVSGVAGCSSAGYYSQAIAGEMSLLMHRRSIDKVLADPSTSAGLKHKLRVAQAVRHYARHLGLNVGESYASYEDIGRRYVVWNVFAAPEFSLELKKFCYPVAGCVTYRGFFKEPAARAFADGLVSKGYDVYMGGVAAYSTLGWFNDPILSTFVHRSDADLAALLFHELAHKTLYVKGDTRFNESYATAVEQVALRRWLAQRGNSDAYHEYLAERSRDQQVIDLIEATNKSLRTLYASGARPDVMRAEKRADIAALRERYAALRRQWGDHDEFAWWMATPINNAKLGTIATYNDWVGGFKAILAQSGGDMPKFIARVKQLARLPKPQRDARLAKLSGMHS